MSLKINIAVSIISICIVSSCRPKKTPKSDIKNQQVNTVTEKDYLQKIFDLDTVPTGKVKIAIILKEDHVFKRDANYNTNPFYHYFKARAYELERKTDSAIIAYKKMKIKKKWDDIDLLKTCSIVDHTINNSVMVEAVLMSQPRCHATFSHESYGNPDGFDWRTDARGQESDFGRSGERDYAQRE